MLDQDLAWLSDLVSTDEIVAMMERIEAGHPFPEAADDPLLSPETSKLTEPEAKRLWGESHKIRKILPRLRCLAPVTPSCPKKPIASHSIQKAGPLSYLSDHSGHVLSLQRSPNPAERPGAQMIKMGVREASTFPGLCPQHDATLFQPIDQPLVQPTPEQLFLLSYRSVLREQYIGRWSERMFSKSLSLAIKARMPRSYIVFMLAHLHRAHWGNQRMDNIAAFYAMLHKQKSFDHALIPLTGQNIRPLPFAISAYFEPVFNPDGSRIPPGVGPDVGPFLTLNVVPHEERSIAVLTYPLQFRETLHNFLQPFRPPINQKAFVERVWETALRYCENIILAPWFWEMIPKTVQQQIVGFYNSTSHAWIPSPGSAISLFDWMTWLPPDDAKSEPKSPENDA